MNAQQRKTVDRFSRAIYFVNSQPELASVSPGFATQIGNLTRALASIEECAPDRGSGVGGKSVEQQRVLRHALRVGQLSPLRRSARVLGRSVAGMPDLISADRISNTQGLLDVAKGALRDIQPYREQFVDTGLAPNFLDQLEGRIQALEMAGEACREASVAAKNAQGALIRALQEGRDALTLLDGAIRQWCNINPEQGTATLTAWNTIVPPRGRVSRKVGVLADGTAADVMAGRGGG
jgi:hypothetical protein